MRTSTFLRQAGLSQDDLESLKYGPTLDSLVLRFCPELREWLIGNVGMKATYVIIESYGLYGDSRRNIGNIALDLGLTRSHARALRGWALKRLRGTEARAALRESGASIARGVLEAKE